MANSVDLAFNVLARDKASQTFDKIGKSSDRLGGKLAKFGKAGAIGAAAAGGAILGKFALDSVKAATEAEEAQKRLSFALGKFPALADTNLQSLQKLNSGLALKTKFDDDAIASGQAVLAQFKLTGKQLEQVTPLLLDYASTTGKDMPSAAQDLGKALLGNAKALKNVGISYKSTGDSTKDFTNITALMREKVGGFADKEGSTAAGKMAILNNQFGELKETVGAKLLPVVGKIAEKTLAFVRGMQDGTGSGGKLRDTIEQVKIKFQAYQPVLQKVGDVLIKIGDFIFTTLIPAWFKLQTTVYGTILNISLTVLDFFTTLTTGAAKAFGWVPGLGDKLQTAAAEMEKFRDKVNATLDGIKDKEIQLRVLTTLDNRIRAGDISGSEAAAISNAARGAASVNLTVNGFVGNERQVVDQMEKALAAKKRSTGFNLAFQ